MAPTRGAGARLITGASAVALAVLVAVLDVSTDVQLRGPVRSFAVAGVAAVLLAVVLSWASVGVAGALALGAAFVTTRYEAATSIDLAAVVVAPALLLMCELVSWSADERTAAMPGVLPRRRAALVAATAIAGFAATALVAWTTTLPVGDALGIAALGATAIALVASAIVSSARRVASRP